MCFLHLQVFSSLWYRSHDPEKSLKTHQRTSALKTSLLHTTNTGFRLLVQNRLSSDPTQINEQEGTRKDLQHRLKGVDFILVEAALHGGPGYAWSHERAIKSRPWGSRSGTDITTDTSKWIWRPEYHPGWRLRPASSGGSEDGVVARAFLHRAQSSRTPGTVRDAQRRRAHAGRAPVRRPAGRLP